MGKEKNKINGEQYWFRHPQSEGFTHMSRGDPKLIVVLR